MTLVLAIDAGKSGTRAARYVDGARVSSVDGPGVENIAEPGGPERIERRLGELVGRLPDGPAPERVSVGSTGVMLPSTLAGAYAEAVVRATGCADVVVTSDVVTSFVGALGLRPGVVVAAGTGAIVLGVGDAGRSAQVDGWGYLVGDAGSGFEIGRRGLASALYEMDGRGGSTVLRDLAVARFGPATRLVETLHGAENPVRVIAGFAPVVFAAAADGDPVATGLVRDAGIELARSARAAAERAGLSEDVAVGVTGGLFRSQVLRAAFSVALGEALPGARVVTPAGDALDGAAALAGRPDDPRFASLLHQTQREATS